MPWGDRTGPMGRGQMTGRRAGFCAGFDGPGFANPGVGFGGGRGMGRGRGFWRGGAPYPYPAEPARTVPVERVPMYEYRKEDELADLKAEKEMIERELKAISERLKELESKK